MMMLSLADVGLILLTTVVCTTVVSLLAAWVLRVNRRGRVAAQFAVVVTAAVASIVSSILAVMAEMFISTHDLTVLTWVIALSTAVSLIATWLMTSHAVKRSVGRLAESTRHLGAGAVVEPAEPGWREFNDLHAHLAATSVQLADARAEVEKLDAARRQFFAWISHDLRTPLAGIRALTEALDEGTAPNPQAYVQTIRSRVDTLTGMVDDLFALSTMQSGALQLQREVVPLLDVLSDAVVDVQPAAAEREITIVQRGVEGHLLWADPRELSRALRNVLANGVRHAPPGSDIVVTAHLREGRLIMSILDQGPGVSSEDLGHMFDVGWRASEARSSDAHSPTGAGAGLGLAIVKGIVDAHGGDVFAQHQAAGFELLIALPAPRAALVGS